jgi:hypothetical protein
MKPMAGKEFRNAFPGCVLFTKNFLNGFGAFCHKIPPLIACIIRVETVGYLDI